MKTSRAFHPSDHRAEATGAFIEINVFATLNCKAGHRTGKVGGMCASGLSVKAHL